MHIKSLDLENVRCFSDVHIDFSVPEDAHGGVTMILGPNMGGKTTLLRSIIWGLFGPRDCEALEGPPFPLRNEIARRDPRAEHWGIAVYAKHEDRDFSSILSDTGPDQPLSWRGGHFSHYFAEGSHMHAPLILYYPPACGIYERVEQVALASQVEGDWLGFSPFRNALSERKFEETMALYHRYRNMAERTPDSVRRLPPERQTFDDRAFLSIVELFLDARLGTQGFNRREDDVNWHIRPVARIHGTPVHERALSDGFASAFALFVDLFVRLEKLASKQSSEVTVLLDEVSGFLHPRWQLLVLPALRKLFPRAQFILTTHSPFIVGSMPNAKVYTIEREKNDSVLVDRTSDSIRVTFDEILNAFGVSRKTPALQGLEAEFDRLIEDRIAGRSTPQKENRINELAQMLSVADPAFRVIANLRAPTPEVVADVKKRFGLL